MVLKKWYDYDFESSCYETSEFRAFAWDFKKYIRKETKTCFDLLSFDRGHFYITGFLRNKVNGKLVYFYTSDVRHFSNEWHDKLLIRTATHEKDFTGGTNNYCSITKVNDVAMSLTYNS